MTDSDLSRYPVHRDTSTFSFNCHRLDYPAGITSAPRTGGEGDDRVLRRGRDARVNDRPIQPVLDEILLFLQA